MANAKKPTNEVALKTTGEISPFATAELPAHLQNQTDSRGSEEVGSNDMVLPRLEIIQAMSPIRKDPNIEGAEEGFLINSVTQQIYGAQVYFVPIYYRMEYLIWQHKDVDGGGFRGSFPSADAANAKLKQILADNPDLIGEVKGKGVPKIEVVDTPIQYGFLIEPDGRTEQLVISMPRSKSKVSRKWNAMINLAGGDRFARVYKIGTFTDKNKKGDNFENFIVQPAGFTPEAAYRAAEKVYEVFRSGAMSVNHESVIDEDEGIGTGETGDNRGGI